VPLAPEVLGDLAATLGGDRKVSDKAGRLLVAAGPKAVAPLVAAASAGQGVKRLRALVLLRDLGAEDQLDRTAAYVSLVGDGECEVRRAAARRLGELGDPAALPALQKASGARVETRGFLGMSRKEAACGAPEAAEAVRRIQAAR